MDALKRIAGFLGAAAFAVVAVLLSGAQAGEYVLAPLTMVSVLALTLMLALMICPVRTLLTEFKRIFRREPHERPNRRLLGLLALFAMVSGLVLAVSHVLTGAGRAPGQDPESLRQPLTCLLYGVLLALALWIVSQEDGDPAPAGRDDPKQLALSAAVLLLAIGLVGYLLVGLSREERPADAPLDKAVVNPFRQASDGSWHVVAGESVEMPTEPRRPTRASQAAGMVPIARESHLPGTLALLRWETDLSAAPPRPAP